MSRIKDALLELRIRAMFRLVRAAHAVERWATQRFYTLIHRRRLEQVARMERKKGLV